MKRDPKNTAKQLHADTLTEKAAAALKEDRRLLRKKQTQAINKCFRTNTASKEMHNRIKSAGKMKNDRAPPSALRNPATNVVEDEPQGVANAYANFIHDLGRNTAQGARGRV